MPQEFYLARCNTVCEIKCGRYDETTNPNYKADLKVKARETFYFCGVPEMEIKMLRLWEMADSQERP